MDSIGDAQGFSGKTPIILSRGFSVKTPTGVTLSWKTKLNRSISTMESKIPRWLQYYHKTCCKKCGCHGRQNCIIWRWYHHSDVISGWVDLHMTGFYVIRILTTYTTEIELHRPNKLEILQYISEWARTMNHPKYSHILSLHSNLELKNTSTDGCYLTF